MYPSRSTASVRSLNNSIPIFPFAGVVAPFIRDLIYTHRGKVSSNNDTIRRKQKSKNTSDGTLLRECDDETIIFSPRCCCDCWEKLLTVFRKQIFIQDDFNDGANAAEGKSVDVDFDASFYNKPPSSSSSLVVGQRILICASRFEVNACFEAFEDKERVSFCRPVFVLFFFRPFPTFCHRSAFV